MSIEVLYPGVAPVVSRVWPAARRGDVEVLQPAETASVVPPAILNGGLDRVSGTGELSSLEDHMAMAVAEQATHAPVLRRWLQNALIHRKGYSTFFEKRKYAPRTLLERLELPHASLPRVRYAMNYCSWRFFGHWMTDAVPTAMIDDHGNSELWLSHPPSWMHCRTYEALFGLEPIRDDVVVARELVTYQDFGQGSHRRARYDRMREILRNRYGDTPDAECVYIRRGESGVRRTISNEDALLEDLTRRGWAVIDIAETDVDTIQSKLTGCRVVASIDGSHLDHAHVSVERGGVMMIMLPHDQFTVRHLGLCRANRVNCGFLVIEGNAREGYHVDIDEFLATVDLAARGPY